jgi:hypothetical protein
MEPMNEQSIWDEAVRLGLPAEGWLLIVDAASQQLAAWQEGRRRGRFSISTGRNGLGNRDGSGCTPTGWHVVAECIGYGAPPGRVFKHRLPQAEVIPPSHWNDEASGDLILSRILRLRGLEPGVNAGPGVDTFQRLIYIHGTAQEHRLGTAASHGCVRMGNRDLVSLFDLVAPHPAWCWIGACAPHPEA